MIANNLFTFFGVQNSRNNVRKLINYLQAALVCGMVVVSAQLLYTYRYFIDEVKQLQEIRLEYQSHCAAYHQFRVLAQQEMERAACNEMTGEFEEGLFCQECLQQFNPPKPVEVIVPTVISSTKRKLRKKNHPLAQKFKAQWPIDRSQFWISSPFGPRKKKNGALGFHYGIDMAALKGTPVHAVAPGKIIEASFSQKGYGKSIVIAHTDGITTRYAHLDKMYVKRGQSVNAGDCIGCVGSTGHVRGKNASHLHLEVMASGKHVDPLYVLA